MVDQSRSGRLGLGKQIQSRSVGDGGTVQMRGGGGSMVSPEWWPVASRGRGGTTCLGFAERLSDAMSPSFATVAHTTRTELLNTIGKQVYGGDESAGGGAA
ncbi:hypothetical protein U1Q18_026898, partial [Sarracenia purpurea var. burkii]